MIWLILSVALAGELRPVHTGDTVENFAEQLGDPGLAEAIRALNSLPDGAQPLVGTLIRLPDTVADAEEQTAWIIEATGQVVVRATSGAPTPAALCDQVPERTQVCTGTDGYATVRLAASFGGAEHDDVNLFPGTCLTVQSAWSSPGRRASVVELASGGIAVSSTGTSKGTVAVQTADGLTSGEEGGYRVTIEEGATRTEALDAPVAVAGAGVEVAVGSGQGTRVKRGQAPQDPIDLLRPGQLLTPAPAEPLRHADFAWSSAELALGYRFELSTDAAFSTLLRQEDVPGTVFSPELLFLPVREPQLYWRVASFDRMGFLGLPTEARSVMLPKGVSP